MPAFAERPIWIIFVNKVLVCIILLVDILIVGVLLQNIGLI